MTTHADEFAEWERAIAEGAFEDALMALEKAATNWRLGAVHCWMMPSSEFRGSINPNRMKFRFNGL